MPTPVFPDLLAAPTVERDRIYEVNTGSTGSPTWTMVGAVQTQNFDPGAANLEDSSDMQSGGAGAQTKTADSASASLTVLRKPKSDGISYDDGQEFLRAKGALYGAQNSVQMRICEYNPDGGPRVEAYMGWFAVGVGNPGGGNTALRTMVFTLAGQGKCAAISHPYPATGVVPTIISVSPTGGSTAGADKLVRITGTGFTGTVATTGVKFGGTNAIGWFVLNDDAIDAIPPAHASGAVAVVVTNATGASTTGGTPYTYA